MFLHIKFCDQRSLPNLLTEHLTVLEPVRKAARVLTVGQLLQPQASLLFQLGIVLLCLLQAILRLVRECLAATQPLISS